MRRLVLSAVFALAACQPPLAGARAATPFAEAASAASARESGNVNTHYAFWRDVNGHFVRLGEGGGDEAADGDVRSHVTHTTCAQSEAPGLALVHLTLAHLTRAAARAKFGAEPAPRVFV